MLLQSEYFVASRAFYWILIFMGSLLVQRLVTMVILLFVFMFYCVVIQVCYLQVWSLTWLFYLYFRCFIYLWPYQFRIYILDSFHVTQTLVTITWSKLTMPKISLTRSFPEMGSAKMSAVTSISSWGTFIPRLMFHQLTVNMSKGRWVIPFPVFWQ